MNLYAVICSAPASAPALTFDWALEPPLFFPFFLFSSFVSHVHAHDVAQSRFLHRPFKLSFWERNNVWGWQARDPFVARTGTDAISKKKGGGGGWWVVGGGWWRGLGRIKMGSAGRRTTWPTSASSSGSHSSRRRSSCSPTLGGSEPITAARSSCASTCGCDQQQRCHQHHRHRLTVGWPTTTTRSSSTEATMRGAAGPPISAFRSIFGRIDQS